MLIPSPRTGRDLFEMLRLYDAEAGIGRVLSRMDLAGMTPRQAVFCTMGRLPPAPAARAPANYNPRSHLRRLLQGDEFQKNLLRRMLECYPEKQRLFFIHLPKCAGTDLTSILLQQMPGFNMRLLDRNWFTAETMLDALGVLVRDLAFADRVLMFAHFELRNYLADNMVRFGDRVFSVVRNPADTIISGINYILTRFRNDTELQAIDTNGWLKLLDHGRIKAALDSEDYRDIAMEMLFTPGMMHANRICQFLGDGTAASALLMCARADVEISHVSRYEEWLALRWGAAGSRRRNASIPMVSADMLGAEGLARIGALTEEDSVFVEKIERKMQEDNTCFVMAADLAI